MKNAFEYLKSYLTKEERKLLKKVINYIADNHSDDEWWKIDRSVRNFVDTTLSTMLAHEALGEDTTALDEEECRKNIAGEKFGKILDEMLKEIHSDENDVPNTEPEPTGKNAGLTGSEIYDTVREYLLPEYEKWEAIGGGLTNCSYASESGWCFAFGNGICRPRDLGSQLINDEWHIYNDYFDSEHESTTNIIIQKDDVHFIEDSSFNDFDIDFMYGLYEKLAKCLYEKLAKCLHDKELNKNE